jgi:NAD kinase
MAKWLLLFATNHSTSSKWINVWWYDKSENTEIEILSQYPITAKTFLRIDGQAYVMLDEGDEIRVQSETGSVTTCIITVELEQRSTVQQFN